MVSPEQRDSSARRPAADSCRRSSRSADFVYEDDERPEVGAHLPEGARTVLDAGCGSGGFARTLRRTYGPNARIVGLEPHPAGAELSRGQGLYDEVVEGRLPDALAGAEDFDLIVFNDVLEHLVDPWGTLVAARSKLTADGRVVATIPNIQYLPVVWSLARHARFDYADTGVLDRTHLRFFTWKTMRDMFLESGYGVERVAGVNSAFQWPPFARFHALRRLAGTMQWMQFVVVARPGAVTIETEIVV